MCEWQTMVGTSSPLLSVTCARPCVLYASEYKTEYIQKTKIKLERNTARTTLHSYLSSSSLLLFFAMAFLVSYCNTAHATACVWRAFCVVVSRVVFFFSVFFFSRLAYSPAGSRVVCSQSDELYYGKFLIRNWSTDLKLINQFKQRCDQVGYTKRSCNKNKNKFQ